MSLTALRPEGARPTPGASGGLESLLAMTRLRCQAAVAFSALRAADGTFSINASPDPIGRSADRLPPWNLHVLGELAREAWVDILSDRAVVMLRTRGPVEPSTMRRADVVLTAVPLRHGASELRPFGLLGVARLPGQGSAKEADAILSQLGQRLSAYLSSRHRVLDLDILATTVDAAAGQLVSAEQRPSQAPGRGGLAQLAIRGGAYLVAREGIGMLLRLIGVVITVRLIGPSSYGLYAGAAAFVTVVATLAQMGVEVYLIRSPGELDRSAYDQAFTFLVCTSTLATAVSFALTFAVAPWLRPVGVVLPLRILLLSVPINVLWAPAQAHIERRFQYRKMGMLELGGDVALYATAIPLALTHFGAWSLVAGNFAWQTWLLVGSLVASGLRPRWHWSTNAMRSLVRHGMGYSASGWIFKLNGVINALVVGSFVGPAGVGFVSFAQNLVFTIGFAARGAYRLGLAAMSKVGNHERDKLRYAIEEGTSLQLIALAVPFAAFAVVARWLVPVLFGAEWTAALPVYCFLSVAALANAPSLIQITLMFSRGENLRVALAALIGAVVLAATSTVLVAEFGTVGFGVATVLAVIDTVYTDRVVRGLTSFGYGRFIGLFAATAPVCLFPLVPLPYALLVVLPMLGLVVVPPLRRETMRLTHVLTSAIGGTP